MYCTILLKLVLNYKTGSIDRSFLAVIHTKLPPKKGGHMVRSWINHQRQQTKFNHVRTAKKIQWLQCQQKRNAHEFHHFSPAMAGNKLRTKGCSQKKLPHCGQGVSVSPTGPASFDLIRMVCRKRSFRMFNIIRFKIQYLLTWSHEFLGMSLCAIKSRRPRHETPKGLHFNESLCSVLGTKPNISGIWIHHQTTRSLQLLL